MNIEEVVKLWKESKYNKLFIKDKPVVRDDKEVVKPSVILHRNHKYCFGKEMSVFEYLLTTSDKKSIYYLKEIDDDTLYFVKII